MENSDNASSTYYQVIVVGAGAAGIGIGVALKDFGVENFIILEKDSIGASFKRWPKETKLLTPSFQSTQFGLLDLNAIALNTSPAVSSGLEHMDGAAYASYLENVTKEFALTVKTNQKIKGVNHTGDMFQVSIGKKSYSCTYLIWATGEFQYPQLMPFKGAQHALHTAKVKSYHKLPGTEYIIIGGYESGLDAALHLAEAGISSLILEKGTINTSSQDPSVSISFYTRQRIAEQETAGMISITQGCKVQEISKTTTGYEIHTTKGSYQTSERPLLATGFIGGEYQIKNLFLLDNSFNVLLNEFDESTKVPNLFLAGPHVRQGTLIFCFIYKFRQRFGIVARTIASRLGLDTEQVVLKYRSNQMYLDDLTCCEQDCKC